jgi:hypothetical protein
MLRIRESQGATLGRIWTILAGYRGFLQYLYANCGIVDNPQLQLQPLLYTSFPIPYLLVFNHPTLYNQSCWLSSCKGTEGQVYGEATGAVAQGLHSPEVEPTDFTATFVSLKS